MSEIPSHIAVSGAQAGYQSQDVARARDAARAGQANAVDRQVKSLNEQDTTVETSDSDTAVFTDSEGAGSQGRSFESADEREDDPAGRGGTGDPGLTTGDDGRLHVDLEA
ncbi:MAG: hypothetical protein C4547_14760 [Phycisphaerales bacterium]|nr:MAG: hypothetical protein C4547_14760 [Phycisphaerales bacterium]